MSSVFKLDFQRNELRLCDQEARKDGSIEVGEALAAGDRTAVANKQARNRILSRAVVVVSRQRKARDGYRLSRVALCISQPATTQRNSTPMPRATADTKRVPDAAEGITSADG